MGFFKKEHVFNNDWNTITAAFWVKYPNDLQPHVLRVDTLDVKIDEEQQKFVCRRLLSLKYHSPKWVQKFFGASPIGFAVEEATCSLKEKTLKLKSCNYTFSSFFRVEEACEYSQHPDDPHLTVYKQTATYKVSGLGIPVNRAIEKAAVAQAAEKSSLGVRAVERISSFLEQQQWRTSCGNCLSSLEEAALHASKQAQQKYRELLQRVEQSLTAASSTSTRGLASAQEGKSQDVTSSGKTESRDPKTSTNVCTGNRDLNEHDFEKTCALISSDLANKRRGDYHLSSHSHVLSLVGNGPTGSSQLRDIDADCPCKTCTPAGTEPMPTQAWMEKQSNDAASGLGAGSS